MTNLNSIVIAMRYLWVIPGLHDVEQGLEEVQGCRVQIYQKSQSWLCYWSLVLPLYSLCLHFRDGSESRLCQRSSWLAILSP